MEQPVRKNTVIERWAAQRLAADYVTRVDHDIIVRRALTADDEVVATYCTATQFSVSFGVKRKLTGR
jgi:hypothetical protein